MYKYVSLKDSDAGRDWGQEEKGMTEDEMAGWNHWLDGESQWTPGVGDGQGGLVCCSSWGSKESDRTEQLNWTEYYIVTEWRRAVRERRSLQTFNLDNYMDCSALIKKKDSLEPWIKYFTTPFLKREQENKNGRETTPSGQLQGVPLSDNPTPLGLQPNIQIQVSIKCQGLYQNKAKELNTKKTDKWQASTWKVVQCH